MGYTQKAVVVGAGISGLTCAFRLNQMGVPCLVFETKDRAGGVIRTVRRNGFQFETGPQCPRFPASLWRLVHSLNLEREFVAGDKKAKRYVFVNGRMHIAPFSPGTLLKTGLLGLPSKWRLLTEPFRFSQPPLEEESLAHFVQRKFGQQVLDNLVDPFISTIFLGDPHKMGMDSAFPALVQWEKNQGSVVRGALRAARSKANSDRNNNWSSASSSNGKRDALHVTDALPSLGAFRSGMGRLPERLAELLGPQVHHNVEIVSVAQESDPNERCWHLRMSNGDQIATEHLVLAVPAYAAARLLAESAPQLSCCLLTIEYAPVCTVSFGYHRSQVKSRLEGFGFMVPRRERLRTICTFWNSSLLPGRAPEGKVVMTSLAGRFSDASIGQEECARAVQAENSRALGITGEPVDRVVCEDLRALPQYNVGHARRIKEIYQELAKLPGLYLAGNFLSGRSVGDCVEVADRVAEDLRSRVSA